MHSSFIEWLKEHKCPDEIIRNIFEEGSKWDDSTFKERIKSCPTLFTALLDNGYKYEAIEWIFYVDRYWNSLAKQEDIAIELVKNKCEYNDISSMCKFKDVDSKKFFDHKEFYVGLLKKLSPLPSSQMSDILDFFVVDCNEQQLKRCMSNQKLLNLLIENYLPSEMLEGILQKDDYRTLNIKNNKELLDLLLREELIFSDKSNQFDRDRKDLVTKDTLIHELLQINDLTIHDLLCPNGMLITPTASRVRKKAEKKAAKSIKLRIKRAQSNLPDEHPAKAEGLAEQVFEKIECNKDHVKQVLKRFKSDQDLIRLFNYIQDTERLLNYNQDEVPSLLVLSVNAIPALQIEEIKVLQEKQQKGCCNIL
ncbi:hypothetical protein [Candidatus Mesenet endosymbiont of Phosphuga atrata]|uniref:hypothetical protein n=1 Tax=Candidatus Mesenet endosymbiont of Phosphuga atrata TaxID=3066221 RepID=UPI0030CD05C5